MQLDPEYRKWLANLPERVKKDFLSLPLSEIRAYAKRRVEQRLGENPDIAAFFDERAKKDLEQRIYDNVLADRDEIRKMAEAKTAAPKQRTVRTINRAS